MLTGFRPPLRFGTGGGSVGAIPAALEASGSAVDDEAEDGVRPS